MKKNVFVITFCVLVLALSNVAWAQTTLTAGDIALIGFNFDNPDELGFVTLTDIESGTVIYFTDNGWQSSGTFRSNEGIHTWTAVSAYSAGDVIKVTLSGPALSGSGDQILAYQGSPESPVFIFALNSEGTGWQDNAIDAATSALPTGLTNGTNAIAFIEVDNGYYSGTTSGTKSDLLTAICNTSNWTTNDTGPLSNALWVSSFSISSGSSGPDDPSPSGSERTTSSISISWTKNSNEDNVMLVYNTENTLGTPVDGNIYNVGNSITGGGTVLYNGGDQTTYTHSSLTQNTTYYYALYSVDAEKNYSSGVTGDLKTLKMEPSLHVTNFQISNVTYNSVTVTWSDNDGVYPADAFLVVLETTANFTPSDGENDPYSSSNIESSEKAEFVDHGVETYTFTNLNSETAYYAKIWPVSNTNENQEQYWDYLTDGTIPSDYETTQTTPDFPDVFFSEYIEGSSDNKALEIYNGTDATINLNEYSVKLFTNGSSSATYTYSFDNNPTLASHEVYVLYNSSASTSISNVGDISASVVNFNGDDAIGLYYGESLIDVIGTIGTDPGTAWDVAGTSGATANHTLLRKSTVTDGNTDWSSSAGSTTGDSEWTVYAEDTFGYLGSHESPASSSKQSVGTGDNVSVSCGGTNINLSFGSVSTGDNISVYSFSNGPSNVSFSGTAPTYVSSYRWVIEAGSSLAFSDGVIKIDVGSLQGIGDYNTVNIYKRSTPGSGAFEMLETTVEGTGGGDAVYLTASISSFSEFILGSDDGDNSLPVELTSFTAENRNGGVALTWRTESETENLGFIIGRRNTENGEWEEIASYLSCEALAGHGSTSEAHDYAYTDAAVVPGATYLYRLADVDYSGKVTYHKEVEVKVEVEKAQTPVVFGLQPAYPNPFNPSLTIPYGLTEDGNMSLKVYNLRGELVEVLLSTYALKGTYSMKWSPQNLSAGIYLVRLESGKRTNLQKVVFVK